ncbi:TetR/AcrR family transcriptional regulator [Anaeromyxobacter sp. Fw109-5]|uniref:TetR/AcrR family transcriptional regulator n=1 Tax=Anaeromyxobacter sp. (strain Fw109-5) TaxID=404589 RepID=UPI0000ED8102|nr:TetR/AcrR family transcriptional regulator [Anaeromyxobacter sp. Fw109-5]ABS25093.1 transcriptional regulator, TetR family [Anaeromyxobacter sp. Fw109-5]
MADVRSPDPSRRSERSRQAILAAAAELVGELGYAKLTIEAVAARAGVGKQTIYRWWPSKGAVVLDAFLALTGGEPGAALPDSGDLEADLKTVTRAIVAELEDPRYEVAARALTVESQADPEVGRQFVEAMLRPSLQATQERLRSAQRSGQLAAGVDLEVGVELLFAPLYYRWLLRYAPLSQAHADRVVDLALAGLRTPPPASRRKRGEGRRRLEARARSAAAPGRPQAGHSNRSSRR